MSEKHTFEAWLGRDNDDYKDYTLSKEHPVAMLSNDDGDTEGFAWYIQGGYGFHFCEREFQNFTGIRLKPGQLARCKVTVEIFEVWDCKYDEEAAEDYEDKGEE